MTNTWQKGSALLMVGVMMISTLVAFISAPVVIADTEITQNIVDLDYNTNFMLEEAVYNIDPTDNSYYELGEAEDQAQDWIASANTVDITLNRQIGGLGDVTLEITSFTQTVFDFQDADEATPVPGSITWDANATASGVFRFTFDILETAVLGHSDSTTRLSMRASNVTDSNIGTFYVWIHISSIFDDPAGAVAWPVVDDMGVGEADMMFEAGDVFAPARVRFTNFGDESINNLECILTPPTDSGITVRNDRALIVEDIATGTTADATYRIDVANNTDAGIYPCEIALTYTRTDGAGFTITEPVDQEVELLVNYNFYTTDPYPATNTESPFQCYASEVSIVGIGNDTRQDVPPYMATTIEQSVASDEEITFQVDITNNGNVDLERVTYMLDIEDSGAPSNWDYFRNPQMYYTSTSGPGTVTDDISIMFDTHPVGEVRSFLITAFVVNDIPIGEHRLPIIYDGFFFDEAVLGTSTDMAPIAGGDGMTTVGDADALELVFSVIVTDVVEIACHVDNIVAPVAGAGAKADITANDITLDLHNDEQYDFIDVQVRGNFTGTPWYNPVIGMGSPLVWSEEANPASPQDVWGAGGFIGLTFTVDTDPDLVPDRYPFSLEITAVINNTLEVVEITIDYTLGAVVDFAGYGPRISIEAFSNSDIMPGEEFNLDITVTNYGDDTLRDGWIIVPSDDTVFQQWDPICDFIGQIQRVSENFTEIDDRSLPGPGDPYINQSEELVNTWEGAQVTLESLDIDSAREIIELNLFIDGVYSSPSARITVIRLIDLGPGENFTANFVMYADKDMVNGKAYVIPVTMRGIDSEDAGTQIIQQISVMTSLPGETYDATEGDWFDTGIKALGLALFFVIIVALFLMVFNKYKGDSEYDDDYDDEDEFGFEDDDDYEPMGMDEAPPVETPEAPPLPPEEQLVEP